MLLQQKRARYEVVVFIAAVASAALIAVITTPTGGLAGLSVLGLWGLSPLLFRPRQSTNAPALDERDLALAHQATLLGFTLSYVAGVLTCMAIWATLYFGMDLEQISVHWLTAPVWVAFATAYAGRAIALLTLYRRQVPHAH